MSSLKILRGNRWSITTCFHTEFGYNYIIIWGGCCSFRRAVLMTLWNFLFMPSVLSCLSFRRQCCKLLQKWWTEVVGWLPAELSTEIFYVIFLENKSILTSINGIHFPNSEMNQTHCCFWWSNCQILFQISFCLFYVFLFPVLYLEIGLWKFKLWNSKGLVIAIKKKKL